MISSIYIYLWRYRGIRNNYYCLSFTTIFTTWFLLLDLSHNLCWWTCLEAVIGAGISFINSQLPSYELCVCKALIRIIRFDMVRAVSWARVWHFLCNNFRRRHHKINFNYNSLVTLLHNFNIIFFSLSAKKMFSFESHKNFIIALRIFFVWLSNKKNITIKFLICKNSLKCMHNKWDDNRFDVFWENLH